MRTSETLTVLLTHQDKLRVSRMLDHWRRFAGSILLVHAGRREDFDEADFEPKIFLDDPRIRTTHHQRERQSYTALYRTVMESAFARQARHIFLAEYDHYPVAPDLIERLAGRLRDEGAALLAHHLRRIDGTNDPHYLQHAFDPEFHRWFAARSRRADQNEILSMFGSGAFWRADALRAVLDEGEPPVPVYHELHFATLAHHLGFRVRGLDDQDSFIRVGCEWNPARPPDGAWALHPVKRAWG